jgi:hypothetical protein
MTRSISTIAREIAKDWSKPYFGAVPYIQAMYYLDRITDKYGADEGRSIVVYFLSNAGSWGGETAKRVKAELNEMIKK